MSLLRADKIANRFNNTGPIIVGPSTVSGNFTVTGILTALGIGVTNSINVGQAITTKYLTSTNGTSLFNTNLNGITTAGIITGATYYGNGVHLSGVVTSVYPGPGIQILPISGQGRVRISATGVAVAGYSTNAGLATDVKGGVAGAVLWQVGPNDTGFTAAGNAGEILQSTGTTAPVWTSVTAINVAYADSAGISTNLKGGSAGRIPYQTGIDATAFLPIGSTGKVLFGQGTLAPIWIDPKASLDVRYSNLSGIATNVIGGVSSVTSLDVTGITTLGGGNVTIENDLNVSGITTSGNLIVTGVGTIGEFYVGVGVAATVGVTTILDEDTMSSDRADALATQQSIKAYVDAQVTAQDLDFNADVGSGAIDLDSEEFTIAGTTNEIYTIGLGNTVTVGLDTNVTIPQDFTVTRNTTLSGLTTITGSLGVTGVTTTQSLQVIGVSTLTTLGVTGVTTSEYLQVAGVTTSQFLNVTGVSTLATLGVSGVTTTQFLEVTGVSTFNDNITLDPSVTVFNGNFNNSNLTGITTVSTLEVSGGTTTQLLDVTGVSTLATLGVSGVTTTQFLEVTGVTTLTSIEVTGISTFSSDIDVDGHTELDNLRVSGVSTFVGVGTFQNDLYVGGDLYISDDLVFDEFTARNGNITGIGTIETLDTTTGTIDYLTGINFSYSGIGTIDTLDTTTGTVDYLTNTNLNVSGIATINQLHVSGVSTFNDYVTIDDGLTVTGTGITVTTLEVTGFSTFTGFATFGSSVNIANEFYSGGISSVGTAITMYPSTGIVSATAFYGDGSNLSGVVGLVSITNILYVTPDGNDENDGYLESSAKRTVGSALTIAAPSTVIKVSAGNYLENNPLVIPEQVSIQGDSLREVSLTPQNIDEDFIYVSNGDYIDNVSFTGTLNNDKAVIAFNPNKPSYINQGPYIRNCTNFITNSIGMKIDGNHAIGDTKSMSVDSYTQYNQGGIGVSISNEGYAQLVSIFTICTDQSIICLNGGACDLTNSNSSFGRLGLVADGVGPQNFIGTVTTAANVDSSTFTLDIGADTLTITDAVYDNISGLVTVTTNTNHDFNVGMSVTMKDLTFTCDSLLPVTSYGISTANYDNVSGIMTVQTSTDNNFYVGASVTFSQLVFSCDSGGGPSTAFFPPAPGDGNGPSNHVFDVISVGTSTEFTVQVGPSTIVHNYVDGGNVSISTFAKFPSGAYGYIFTIDQVGAANSFSAYVGVSTLSHTYVSGGEVETFVSRPYDGQVVYFDELYQTISGVAITEGGSGYGNSPPTVTFSAPSEPWGIRATGVANLTNGSVTGVDMISNGRGYTSSPTVTFSAPPSGTTALGTATTLPTYYVVSSATPIVNGITTVTFTENVPYAVGVGTSVPFFKQSRVLASSHAFEYIGSGNTISRALPQRGGVGIQANEIVNRNGGLVVYTSTDQAGNFRIGDGVVINQLDGSISGDAYSRSLFANITPYILALGGGD